MFTATTRLNWSPASGKVSFIKAVMWLAVETTLYPSLTSSAFHPATVLAIGKDVVELRQGRRRALPVATKSYPIDDALAFHRISVDGSSLLPFWLYTKFLHWCYVLMPQITTQNCSLSRKPPTCINGD